MEEVFKPIVNYITIYHISETGNVKNIKTGKIIKPHVSTQGYIRIGLFGGGKQVKYAVHRLVYEAFNGPIPGRMTIKHKDGNKLNNHFGNLEVMTASENIRHSWEIGIRTSETVSKLSKDQVIEIKKLIVESNISFYEIAEKFKVHHSTIANIKAGNTWCNTGEDLSRTKRKQVRKAYKITQSQIHEIKTLLKEGQTGRFIAKKFNVCPSTISNIKKLNKRCYS